MENIVTVILKEYCTGIVNKVMKNFGTHVSPYIWSIKNFGACLFQGNVPFFAPGPWLYMYNSELAAATSHQAGGGGASRVHPFSPLHYGTARSGTSLSLWPLTSGVVGASSGEQEEQERKEWAQRERQIEE